MTACKPNPAVNSFCEYSFIRTQTHSFIYILSMAAFTLEHQSTAEHKAYISHLALCRKSQQIPLLDYKFCRDRVMSFFITQLSAWHIISESESHSVVSDFLLPHGLYCPWNSPGQNTGVDCLSLLQGIFPTQGSNPGIPHCRQILYQLSHQGSPAHNRCIINRY